MQKKIETGKGLALKIVNPNAAGIDIAATEMQVCVPSDLDGENNRRFGCFTKDLHEISSYLKVCGIDTVAMESTGIYRLPLFMILKKDGFDVILVNPRDIKSYSDLEGVRNPVELARLAHSRCKSSNEVFEASLEGTWDKDHLFELKQSLEDYKHFQRQANECESCMHSTRYTCAFRV